MKSQGGCSHCPKKLRQLPLFAVLVERQPRTDSDASLHTCKPFLAPSKSLSPSLTPSRTHLLNPFSSSSHSLPPFHASSCPQLLTQILSHSISSLASAAVQPARARRGHRTCRSKRIVPPPANGGGGPVRACTEMVTLRPPRPGQPVHRRSARSRP